MKTPCVTTNSEPKPTAEEVQEMLARIDWEEYWKTVSERVDKEVGEYEIASARSRAAASHLVFL